jgi:hypothetical protein
VTPHSFTTTLGVAVAVARVVPRLTGGEFRLVI